MKSQGEEESGENSDDLQWEGVYCLLVFNQTYSFDTRGVISILSASEDAPVNKIIMTQLILVT